MKPTKPERRPDGPPDECAGDDPEAHEPEVDGPSLRDTRLDDDPFGAGRRTRSARTDGHASRPRTPPRLSPCAAPYPRELTRKRSPSGSICAGRPLHGDSRSSLREVSTKTPNDPRSASIITAVPRIRATPNAHDGGRHPPAVVASPIDARLGGAIRRRRREGARTDEPRRGERPRSVTNGARPAAIIGVPKPSGLQTSRGVASAGGFGDQPGFPTGFPQVACRTRLG
jgi:hypothetical protein